MMNGCLITAKIEFKAWNHHEGGRNPSLFWKYAFIFSFVSKHEGIFGIQEISWTITNILIYLHTENNRD